MRWLLGDRQADQEELGPRDAQDGRSPPALLAVESATATEPEGWLPV